MKLFLGPTLGTKHQAIEHLLEHGLTMVHLDARHPEVDVPDQFKRNPHLRLNLSHNFGIDDFEVLSDRAQASLSFGGKRHFCILPYNAVFMFTSQVIDVGYVWPADVPTELAPRLNPAFRNLPAAEPLKPTRPAFRVIEGAVGADAKTPLRVIPEQTEPSSDSSDDNLSASSSNVAQETIEIETDTSITTTPSTPSTPSTPFTEQQAQSNADAATEETTEDLIARPSDTDSDTEESGEDGITVDDQSETSEGSESQRDEEDDTPQPNTLRKDEEDDTPQPNTPRKYGHLRVVK